MTIIGSAPKLKMYRTILKTKIALTCEVQQKICMVSLMALKTKLELTTLNILISSI